MTTEIKTNFESKVNPDRLSDNHKQMYDLVTYVINKVYEVKYEQGENINKKDLISLIFNNAIKVYKIKPKQRNRRIIDKNKCCMGRKLDTLQCTRKRLEGNDYCLSHLKNRPNGRIDENIIAKKKKGKRGRKRKNNYDPKQIDDNYSTMWEVIIDNEKFFVDIRKNVFTFDLEKPKFLGRQNLEGKIEKVPPKLK